MNHVSLPNAPSTVAVPPATRTPGPAVAAPGACANCGGGLLGPFCHGCGQQVRTERLTVRGIFAHLVTDALDLNRGILFTAVSLFRRPGEAVREYLAGATVRYTNPVKYLLLLVALAALVFLQVDLVGRQAAMFGEPLAPQSAEAQRVAAEAQAKISAWVNAHLNLLLVASVPLTAWFNRRLFRATGINYAEFLVFTMFVYAQTCLISVVLVPLALGAGLDAVWMTAASGVNVAYSVWAVTSFTRSRPASGIARGLGAQLLGLVATILLISLVAGAAGFAYAWYRLS